MGECEGAPGRTGRGEIERREGRKDGMKERSKEARKQRSERGRKEGSKGGRTQEANPVAIRNEE